MKVRVRTRPRIIPLPEEFEALLWVLNATGEQVKQWASSLPPEDGYDRDFDGWGGISLLLQDPEWEGSKEQVATLLRQIAEDFVKGQTPTITKKQRLALRLYAEYPTKVFIWKDGEMPRIDDVPQETRRLNLAVRGLWRILASEAELRRCPAPKPFGWPSDRCGKYFVTGATRGNPARYCSDTCRARDFRRRKAREEREARSQT